MRTACGQPCSTVAQLALPVASPYSSPSHRCIRGLMPHHSCFSCASSGRGPGSGRGYQPRSSGRPRCSGRPSGSGRGRGTFGCPGEGWAPAAVPTTLLGRPSGSGRGRGSFSVQNSGFFVSRRGLKYVPTSDQGDRDFYTQLTHAVYTNHPADNSDVWVPVTTKGVKTQVDFSPGGFSSSYMRGCLLSGKNKFSGSAN